MPKASDKATFNLCKLKKKNYFTEYFDEVCKNQFAADRSLWKYCIKLNKLNKELSKWQWVHQ